MNRYTLICFTILLTSLSVLAYNANRPEWNEFCPFGMENAEYTQPKWYDSSNIANTNYWAQRRADFENSLQQCDAVPTNQQDSCYNKLRTRQQQLNVQRQEYLLQKQYAHNQYVEHVYQYYESQERKKHQDDPIRVKFVNY